MANNRLFAVCLHESHEPAFELVLKYYPSQGWFLKEGESLGEFMETHKHKTLFGNCIVFVPEVCGRDEMHHLFTHELAQRMFNFLHLDSDRVREGVLPQ